jgi:hypothetical protein
VVRVYILECLVHATGPPDFDTFGPELKAENDNLREHVKAADAANHEQRDQLKTAEERLQRVEAALSISSK